MNKESIWHRVATFEWRITHDQIRNQVRFQVYEQIESQVRTRVWDQVANQVDQMLHMIKIQSEEQSI